MARVYAPDELLKRYREHRDSMSTEDFFRKPGMARIREMWCAAHFSRAYERYCGPCRIRIDENDEQDDVDFELEVADDLQLFQVAEVMDPQRRRADEYKDFVPGRTSDADWGPGTRSGPDWIASVLTAKSAKRYAREADLNLLLYLNFPAYEQNYYVIRDRTRAHWGKFKSIWLLNGNALCVLKPSPILDSFEEWLMIPESSDRDAP